MRRLTKADVPAIERICRDATAHNHGQTVRDVSPTLEYQGPGKETAVTKVLVQLSSWPRVDEARQALAAAGYVSRENCYDHFDGLVVTGWDMTPERMAAIRGALDTLAVIGPKPWTVETDYDESRTEGEHIRDPWYPVALVAGDAEQTRIERISDLSCEEAQELAHLPGYVAELLDAVRRPTAAQLDGELLAALRGLISAAWALTQAHGNVIFDTDEDNALRDRLVKTNRDLVAAAVLQLPARIRTALLDGDVKATDGASSSQAPSEG